MEGKRRITRKEREGARQEASRRFGEVADLTVEARRNDEMGSHYTVWLEPTRRVEWWPGAQHWRDADRADLYGSMDEFIGWLAAHGRADQ